MSIEFDMSEVNALAAEFAAAPVKATMVSSASMTTIAAKLRDDARAAAPVATGALRNSIVVRSGRDHRTVSATAPYSSFVEFGTSDTAPQPFMWPQVPAASRALEEALLKIDPFG